MIRKILYTCCMSCIQYNEYIKAYYHHLIDDNHKKPKAALVACMRKLLLLAHYIYTNKTTYKPVEVKQNEKAKQNKKVKINEKVKQNKKDDTTDKHLYSTLLTKS